MKSKIKGYKVGGNMNGTSYHGHNVRATYSQLVKLLGTPEESDGYKVSGEWCLEGPNGETVTVYDWKSTSLYDGDGPSVADFRADRTPQSFHIGGHEAADTLRFQEAIDNALKNK